MNSTRHLNFQEIAFTIEANGGLRKQLMSYALGVVAASLAALPSQAIPPGPADPIRDHYTRFAEPEILEAIDSFNEQIVIDLTLAQEVAHGYWMARYQALYPLRAPLFKQGQGTPFESRYLHLSRTLSDNTQSLGLNHADHIAEMTNHIYDLLTFEP